MKLTVEELPTEDTWKDIVRIHETERLDKKGKVIKRGTICRIEVGGKSKWVVARGLSKKRGLALMDRNVRTELGVKPGEAPDFSLTQISWLRGLWFPWKASDPIYRVPAQLGLISFILGLIALVLGIVALIPHG